MKRCWPIIDSFPAPSSANKIALRYRFNLKMFVSYSTFLLCSFNFCISSLISSTTKKRSVVLFTASLNSRCSIPILSPLSVYLFGSICSIIFIFLSDVLSFIFSFYIQHYILLFLLFIFSPLLHFTLLTTFCANVILAFITCDDEK